MRSIADENKARQLIKELTRSACGVSLNWFKKGPNQYAEHDKFLGIRVPEIRRIIQFYGDLSFVALEKLLQSEFNEIRFAALIILVKKYQSSSLKNSRKIIFNFYKKNVKYINNWNLVDCSAHLIIGAYLFDKDKMMLYQWIQDKKIWKRRIAIVATWHFIRQGDFNDTLALSKMLFNDKEDLLHKAAGWMLREVGKNDRMVLERFIKENHLAMPRVMLRYAIEHFPETKRRTYLIPR